MLPSNKRSADALLDQLEAQLADSDPDEGGRSSPQQPPQKRVRGPGKKNTETVEAAEPKLPVISYTISVFTLAQMQLDPKKRGKPKSTCIQLKSDITWDTFKAKLLSKVDSILKPKTIEFQHYVVTFSVARRHPTPTNLDDEDSYKFMVDRAIDSKTNVSASITIEPVVLETKSSEEKENRNGSERESSDSSETDDERTKKKKKKKKKTKSSKKDPADLSGNKAIIREIGRLREHWQCHSTSCGSSHCYIHPEDQKHMPLSHTHFNIWASAMVKGDDCASLEKPPNHKTFDFAPDFAKGKQSPLLQRRAAALNQVTPAAMAPVFNFNVPPELFGHQPSTPSAPPGPAPSIMISAPNQPLYSWTVRPELVPTIADFCKSYTLDDVILDIFTKHRFTNVSQLRFLTLSHLQDMQFSIGDIAAIQDALDSWRATATSNEGAQV